MIHLEHRDTVAVLRLAHGKVNALDAELLAALCERLGELERSPARALVLTGSGSSFSAGVDLWRVLEGGAGYLDEFVPLLCRALSDLFAFPRPVVAALNGHAIAGGCVLALACDYRLMAAGDARIGVPELRVGVPFPAIAFEVVRSAVPAWLFGELVYRGALFGPDEAKQRKLIEEVVAPGDLLDRALSVAEGLAAIPAVTFAATKTRLRGPILERAARDAAASDRETARIWGSAEVTGAIRAYMEATVRRNPPEPDSG